MPWKYRHVDLGADIPQLAILTDRAGLVGERIGARRVVDFVAPDEHVGRQQQTRAERSRVARRHIEVVIF